MLFVLGLGSCSILPLFLSFQFIPTSNELKHLDSSAINDFEIEQVYNEQNILFKEFLFTGVILGSLILHGSPIGLGGKK